MINKEKLNRSDIDFLIKEVSLSPRLLNKLMNNIKTLNLTNNDLIELDEHVADQLCIDGFNSNDEVTPKGLRLESLRDILYEMLEKPTCRQH